MSFIEFKKYLGTYMHDMGYTKNDAGFYCCPFCGSGSKLHRTPAMILYPDGGYYCHSCHEHGDIYDMISRLEGIKIEDTFIRARELYGNCTMTKDINTKKTDNQQVTQGQFRDYIIECKNHIHETNYFRKRGLSERDEKRFSLGYDCVRQEVVIPYSRDLSYYMRRSVEGKRFYKPSTKYAGSEPIYNAAALQQPKPCFVCESPIDAMSIMSVSECNAVALGGTGIKKILKYIDINGSKATIIVSFDDDEGKERNQGLEATKELIGELMVRRVPCIMADYSTEQYPPNRRKDPNDMLVSERAIFAADISANISAAYEIANTFERRGQLI